MRLRMKNFNFMRVHWKIRFLGGLVGEGGGAEKGEGELNSLQI